MDETRADQFSAPLPGYSNYTDARSHRPGRAADAVVESVPVLLPGGSRLTESRTGPIPGIGGDLTYFAADRPHSYSNRVNISVQRQLPQNIILDVTYFYNRTSQVNTVNYNINQVDPRIALQYGAATNATGGQSVLPSLHPQSSPRVRCWNQSTIPVTHAGKAVSGNTAAILTVIDGDQRRRHDLPLPADQGE